MSFIANGATDLWDGAPKSNVTVPIGANTEWKAEDANDVRDALLQLREVLIDLGAE